MGTRIADAKERRFAGNQIRRPGHERHKSVEQSLRDDAIRILPSPQHCLDRFLRPTVSAPRQSSPGERRCIRSGETIGPNPGERHWFHVSCLNPARLLGMALFGFVTAGIVRSMYNFPNEPDKLKKKQ